MLHLFPSWMTHRLNGYSSQMNYPQNMCARSMSQYIVLTDKFLDFSRSLRIHSLGMFHLAWLGHVVIDLPKVFHSSKLRQALHVISPVSV